MSRARHTNTHSRAHMRRGARAPTQNTNDKTNAFTYVWSNACRRNLSAQITHDTLLCCALTRTVLMLRTRARFMLFACYVCVDIYVCTSCRTISPFRKFTQANVHHTTVYAWNSARSRPSILAALSLSIICGMLYARMCRRTHVWIVHSVRMWNVGMGFGLEVHFTQPTRVNET